MLSLHFCSSCGVFRPVDESKVCRECSTTNPVRDRVPLDFQLEAPKLSEEERDRLVAKLLKDIGKA